ncbi:DUF1353 domain-containing protein [Pseudomonas sp. LRF_L74]|uniref:DUF1353 domain-containing protein n=1 Tax=Pseudomonas sp. LRF_L74 TaxID=3369422 RepID=UPI003F621052
MDRFLDPLQVEQTERHTWRLIGPLSFMDPEYGRQWSPAGTETDFASVRPLRNVAAILLLVGFATYELSAIVGVVFMIIDMFFLSLYAGVIGHGAAAAALHDRLYATGELSRPDADKVLFNALCASGYGRWRAWLVWAGVRLFCVLRYNRRRAA